MNREGITLTISPRRVLIALVALSVALLGLSIWGQYLRHFQRLVDIRPWMEVALDILNHKFNMDAETNVPTWFSTTLLLAASGLCTLIGIGKLTTRAPFRFHWMGLGALFLLMSVDEASALHEMLITPMREWLGVGGWFYFAWVIPAMAGLLVLAVAYTGFFLRLRRGIRLLFGGSLVVYFAGAVGAELLSGRLAAAVGQRSFNYAVIASVEETVEMIGASLAVFALLRILFEDFPRLGIAAGPSRARK